MTTSRRSHRPRPAQSEEPIHDALEANQPETPTEEPATPDPKPVESLNLEFAGPLRRFYAFAIDIGILLMIVFMVAPVSGGRVFSAQAGIIDVFIFLAYFIIPTGLFGRTLGKWVAGISVVDNEGNKPGVAVAIPREVVGRFVSTITFGIGIIWVIFDEKHQGWHDKMAGTYVVVVPNSGGPGFFGRMFAPRDEAPPDQTRQQRVGRPTTRRKRRNRRRN